MSLPSIRCILARTGRLPRLQPLLFQPRLLPNVSYSRRTESSLTHTHDQALSHGITHVTFQEQTPDDRNKLETSMDGTESLFLFVWFFIIGNFLIIAFDFVVRRNMDFETYKKKQ